ncbi:MAG: hypothetical protein WC956_09440 [bacterium]
MVLTPLPVPTQATSLGAEAATTQELPDCQEARDGDGTSETPSAPQDSFVMAASDSIGGAGTPPPSVIPNPKVNGIFASDANQISGATGPVEHVRIIQGWEDLLALRPDDGMRYFDLNSVIVRKPDGSTWIYASPLRRKDDQGNEHPQPLQVFEGDGIVCIDRMRIFADDRRILLFDASPLNKISYEAAAASHFETESALARRAGEEVPDFATWLPAWVKSVLEENPEIKSPDKLSFYTAESIEAMNSGIRSMQGLFNKDGVTVEEFSETVASRSRGPAARPPILDSDANQVSDATDHVEPEKRLGALPASIREQEELLSKATGYPVRVIQGWDDLVALRPDWFGPGHPDFPVKVVIARRPDRSTHVYAVPFVVVSERGAKYPELRHVFEGDEIVYRSGMSILVNDRTIIIGSAASGNDLRERFDDHDVMRTVMEFMQDHLTKDDIKVELAVEPVFRGRSVDWAALYEGGLEDKTGEDKR